jgi:outer membrane lipoprotein-sorting protein
MKEVISMGRLMRAILLGILLPLLALPLAHSQEELTAQEILERAVAALYPENFVAVTQLENVGTEEEQPVYKFQVYRKGSDKVLLKILEPEEAEGQAILRLGDEIWIFYPTICKLLPLGSKAPLFGTAFSFGDLARLDLVQDYMPTLLGVEELEDQQAYKLELEAVDETIAYARVLYWVMVESFLPLRAEFYTISGKLLRILTYTEPRELAGAIRPSKFIMESTMEEIRTIMTILEMEARDDLPDELFTEEYLLETCES